MTRKRLEESDGRPYCAGLWYTHFNMLSLEHLRVDTLILVLLATALAIVCLRVTAALGKLHVARQCERAIARVKQDLHKS